TGSKSAGEGAAAGTEGSVAVATAEQVVVLKPVVYERTETKRKKKYSRGLKDAQRFEVDASRAAERLAQAVADGLSEYRSNRDKSARKKRDGAVKDVVRNAGLGLSKALEVAAQAPADLTRSVTPWKLARLLAPPPLRYFVVWK
ncbi:MAG TPA: hypothetical protein VMM92_07490, partial [Thermoanaerobaculia bacterium]|nr:hypothetical protein [Thermoanaerobaculia bacterium]